MSIFEQAPVLLKFGTKERGGLFSYRPHELEYALCCCLGDRDMVALKTMLFFTGNSNDGSFRVAQRTIFDRMNISEKRYYEARKKLQEMGWIYYSSAENAIYVNYNRIYADYNEYLKKNQAGGSADSPNAFGIHDSPVVKEEPDWSLDELTEYFDDSPSDSHQDRYNNIKNNRTNTIKNKISSGAGCPGGQPPQDLIDKAFEYRNRRDYWDEYMKSLEKWIDETLTEMKLPVGSAEYKAQYHELETIANRCLRVMYGYTNSIDAEDETRRGIAYG